jgi:Flp pilus assembly protein TadD
VRLDQNTTLQILVKRKGDASSVYELLQGAIDFFSRVKRSLDVRTPFVTAAIRGTEFQVRALAAGTRIDVFEGEVDAEGDTWRRRLGADRSLLAQAGLAPRIEPLVNSADAVQWALHYPSLVAVIAAAADDDRFVAAAAAAERSQLPSALAELDGLATGQRDGRYHALKAAMLLTVGRVDTAEIELARAARFDDAAAEIASVRAVIATAKGRLDTADAEARRAVVTGPNAVGLMALSFVQQRRRQLDAALDSVLAARTLQPNTALIHARLADLLLAHREVDKALAAAREAVELDPNLASAHSALGFVQLVRRRADSAMLEFRRAIALDQGAPLPRLGLGLALINGGHLVAGREQMEIATALSPRRSMLRSYLGQAYYEEKRNAPSRSQYRMAERLDPADPTPWLYASVLSLSENRPVLALEEAIRSIELNDQRAVYRSPLRLDEDLAARSVGVGGIFDELSFGQLALVEGGSAIRHAPMDPGGHYLLSDLYADLPRHEVARVSEYLQARLLQPASSRPVQPLMAETQLTTPDGIGPADPSLNEYGSLFDRDGARAWISGVIGNQDALGDEVLVSWLNGPVALSAGQYHYRTDGYRDNNDQSRDILVGFVQWDIDHATSLQAEVRGSELRSGDLRAYIDPDLAQADERLRQTQDSWRLGLRRAFGPDSMLLASVIRSRLDTGFESGLSATFPTRSVPASSSSSESFRRPSFPFFPPFDVLVETRFDGRLDLNGMIEGDSNLDRREDGFTAELRYLWQRGPAKLSLGGGYYEIDSDSLFEIPLTIKETGTLSGITTTTTTTSLLGFIIDTQTATEPLRRTLPRTSADDLFRARYSSETQHLNLYGYLSLDLHPSLVLDLGLGYDDFSEDLLSASRSSSRINPKLGVTWLPFAGTTIRAAFYRTLLRPMVTYQTIEPTQVAGFNQFFQDTPGDDVRHAGIALDQRFGPRLFAGLALQGRDNDSTTIEVEPDIGTGELRLRPTAFGTSSRSGLAYAYWAPARTLALAAEYHYDSFENADTPATTKRDETTHWLPLTLSWSDPSGLSTTARATYVQQDLIPDPFNAPLQRDQSGFWNLDLGLRWRLPKRAGFVSLQVSNLLDRELRYQEIDTNRPLFLPARTVALRAALKFD